MDYMIFGTGKCRMLQEIYELEYREDFTKWKKEWRKVMKIKIGKYIWEIIFVDNLFEALGNTFFNKLTIKISKDQTNDMLKDTIFHETMHAYIKSYGFNKEYYYEEEIVCFVTQNIKQITSLSNKIYRKLCEEK